MGSSTKEPILFGITGCISKVFPSVKLHSIFGQSFSFCSYSFCGVTCPLLYCDFVPKNNCSPWG